MIESLYIDGLQIHDTTNYALTNFTIGSPAPRQVSGTLPFDDGALDATRFYGPRSFEVAGEVWADTMANWWAAVDALKGAVALDSSLKTLQFRREGLAYDETALVRIDGAFDLPVSNAVPYGVFGFSLFASDPRIYSATQTIGSYDPTELAGGGLLLPVEFPLDFNATNDPGISLTNGGNFPTPPVFTITGPVTNPVITNMTTDQSITTQNFALLDDDVCVIDVRSRTLRLGSASGTSRPDLIDASATTWFNLAVGTNAIRMSGTGMTSGTTELSVSFYDARI